MSWTLARHLLSRNRPRGRYPFSLNGVYGARDSFAIRFEGDKNA